MGFVLYRSSAGSGKTYALVKEYLKLLLDNPEKFKHILAITFTNKAAGEMKERIMEALKKLARGEDKTLEQLIQSELPKPIIGGIDKISSEILTQLLHNYSDFAIMTIDSFIHRVTKAFALEIGLPLNFTVVLDNEQIETYVTEKLMEKVGRDGYITRLVLEYVRYNLNHGVSWRIEEQIHGFLAEFFGEKNLEAIRKLGTLDGPPLLGLPKQLIEIRDAFIEELKQLGKLGMETITRAGFSTEDFPYKSAGAAGFLEKCQEFKWGNIEKVEVSKRFRDQVWLKNNAKSKKDLEQNARIEGLLESGLEFLGQRILDHIEEKKPRGITAHTILRNIYLTTFISHMDSLIRAYKRINNVVPISDFNIQVNRIVTRSPVPFLYAMLGERYHHYLIDEFQDTSRMQWENLWPLVENALASNHFNMSVGDGKQSIYRWRGGDVEVMEQDIEEKVHPEQLDIRPLGHNYRSRETIVDFNNDFFKAVSGFYSEKEPVELLQKIYSDIAQAPVNREKGFVSLQFYQKEKDNDLRDMDAVISHRIEEIIEDNETRGYGKNDIAILVRNKKEGRQIANFLLENRIAVVSPDVLFLAKVPLIRFLLDVLYYLRNPRDKIVRACIVHYYYLNVDNSPMDAAEIGRRLLMDKDWEMFPAFHAFSYHRDRLFRMPIYELMEEIIRTFDLAEAMDFDTRGYLQAFLDVTATYAVENSVDVSSFLDWWEAANTNDFTLMVPETKPAVKIMTIHKAKGLEFPVVIIPYSNWAHKLDDKLWLQADPFLETNPLLNFPMLVNRKKSLKDSYFRTAVQEEESKVAIDNINLLYVAFTRAVDSLYIISHRKKPSTTKKSGEEPRATHYDLLRDLAAPMMTEDPETEDHFTLGHPTTKKTVPSKAVVFGPSPAEADELISNDWHHRVTIRRKSKEFWRFDTGYREKQRNWGILVHQVLSQLRNQDDIPRVLDTTMAAGEMESTDRHVLEEKLEKLFQMEEVKAWFAPGHEVFAESSIITATGTIRPDRVLVRSNKVTVIDFKTGRRHPAHNKQVQTYMNAVAAMGYRDIEGFLLYIDTQRIFEVKHEK